VNPVRFRGYLKDHPAALFVIAFQLLLGSAAILVVFGNSPDANQLGVYAFILVTIATLVLLVRVIKSPQSLAKPRAGSIHIGLRAIVHRDRFDIGHQ
jgi:membrane protein implicated in regulation of membrane protease activity